MKIGAKSQSEAERKNGNISNANVHGMEWKFGNLINYFQFYGTNKQKHIETIQTNTF